MCSHVYNTETTVSTGEQNTAVINNLLPYCRSEDDDPRKHSFFKTINFHRLEANLIDPPFVPDPSVVYAKDVADIADFSEIRGIEFDDKDKKFFKKFATGAVSIPWQEEIIETGLFEELNDPNRVDSGGYANGGEAKSGVCLLL